MSFLSNPEISARVWDHTVSNNRSVFYQKTIILFLACPGHKKDFFFLLYYLITWIFYILFQFTLIDHNKETFDEFFEKKPSFRTLNSQGQRKTKAV